VGVVVRDVKAVNLGTRKDEEIRERNGHAHWDRSSDAGCRREADDFLRKF